MTRNEMEHLEPGDIVEHARTGERYMVTSNYGSRVTAVQVADITNPPEWRLVSAVTRREEDIG